MTFEFGAKKRIRLIYVSSTKGRVHPLTCLPRAHYRVQSRFDLSRRTFFLMINFYEFFSPLFERQEIGNIKNDHICTGVNESEDVIWRKIKRYHFQTKVKSMHKSQAHGGFTTQLKFYSEISRQHDFEVTKLR